MCPTRESISDYRSLTPEQWERARQQILGRAHAARARALRELAGAVVHPLQAIVAGAVAGIVDLAEAVAATARKWGRAYALRRERKAAARELRALDDRTLRDIGVNRSEIDWVVYGRDQTRLRDSTIAAKRCRQPPARAGSGTRAKPINKHAA